jgi:tetraacyldisaccharide 4'-kinase
VSGPLPNFLKPITRPASWVYGSVVAQRNRRFDRGRGIVKIDRPVISVGNITTGGVGKTPMVMWIARHLLSQHLKPVIAMRGYAARPGEQSDEEAEYRQRLPEVAVLANPDRVATLQAFLPKHPEVDCVILDDGFQHRQLHRDLDLVLIDATCETMRDRLLPEGNLREPLENLRRADAVVITHAEAVDERLAQDVWRFHGRAPLAWSRHQWTQLLVHRSNGEKKPEPVEWLRDKRVLMLVGIGNPKAMIEQVEAAGAKVAVNIPAADHERYDSSKLRMVQGLCDGNDAMVVTMKDWVKLIAFEELRLWPVPIVVPQLEMEVFEGARVLGDLFLRASAAGGPAG